MATASAVASKGVPLAALLKELLASPSASGKTTASARRLSISKLFSADSSDEDAVAAARRRERDLSIAKLFSGDVLDEATKMRLLLPLTEDGGAASRTGFSSRGWWVSKEDGDAVQLKVAMPGLGKEHVKMRVEKDVLAFKMDQIKAEMNNGMVSLTVPKIKDEERKDVFEIKIE
ncbi:unnamed protein product [Miscanthus lutarioriparius]|uniref:SHSP domain-containing protein n=1 Tax=Miscanthus lutarioriparius TaxID=422564 RepID=A0A811S463_9POAL|nr:unnamed protein product [Miscanthus lutarioriparius]